MLYAAVYEKNRKKVRLYPLNEVCDADSVTITLPDNRDMEQLAVYAFALTKNKHTASPTVWVQVG